MLYIYENNISDAMGMLCRFLYLWYNAIHSHSYLEQKYGNKYYNREQTVLGVFHYGCCYITPDFLCSCSVWIYPKTFLAVSMLQTPISVLCPNTRGQLERKRVLADYKRATYQICETKILSADHSVSLPGVQMQVF